MDTDRNLLYGMLALHNGFLSRDQLLEGMTAWLLYKDQPLSRIFLHQGSLSADDARMLDGLVDRHVTKHGGVQQSMSSLVVESSVRESLRQLGDADVQASIVSLGQSPPTVFTPPPTPTAAWQRYRPVHPHAKGGLGEVSRAVDEELHREVALKQIQDRFADDPDSRRRFVREAEITGNLEHPGIVPVYGLCIQPDGRPVYAMRFIEGETLHQAINRLHGDHPSGQPRPTLRELLTRFVAVCHAMAYAHSRWAIHRDLKPANVMLGDFGETIVLDWGLARLLDGLDADLTTAKRIIQLQEEESSTRVGFALGTPQYMSPEQARGENDKVGVRSDVFALGAILYAILTGREPYPGKDAIKLAQQAAFPRPRQLKRSVPKALEAVCLKAMAARAEDRYPKARELGEEVERWLADEPVRAYPDPLVVRMARWARRHQAQMAALSASVLVLAMTLAAGTVFLWQQQEKTRLQVRQRITDGLDASKTGDLDRAVNTFAEASGLCKQAGHLTSLEEEIAGHVREVERFRTFRAKATAVLRDGVHNIRSRKDDPLLRQAEEALALYEVETADDWAQRLSDTPLTSPQVEEVKRLSHELLILTAIRLALYYTNDEAGKVRNRRALKLLDRAGELEAPSPGVWMLRWRWHRQLGNKAEGDAAMDRMGELVKAGGMKAARDYYLFGSLSLQVLKNPKSALQAYQQALSREPNHYGALFGSFLCYSELKDPGRQIGPLTACLAMRPDEVELYYFRGMAYFSLKQYSLAHQDFDASVGRDPKFAKGYFYRGRMQVVVNEWDKADKDFTLALDIEPTFTQCRIWRAIARAKLDRPREAIRDAEEAVRQEAGEGQTLFFAARVYAQAVRTTRADKDNPRRQQLEKQYGDRALELLRKALDAGYRDERISPDGDLSPLRDRPEFQQLLQRAKDKGPP